MRSTPLVGEKPWFGPRRFGWGLSPVSAEGWAATALAVVAALVLSRRFPDRPLARQLPGLVLVAVAVAKGTSPGGARAHRELRSDAPSGAHPA